MMTWLWHIRCNIRGKNCWKMELFSLFRTLVPNFCLHKNFHQQPLLDHELGLESRDMLKFENQSPHMPWQHAKMEFLHLITLLLSCNTRVFVWFSVVIKLSVIFERLGKWIRIISHWRYYDFYYVLLIYFVENITLDMPDYARKYKLGWF